MLPTILLTSDLVLLDVTEVWYPKPFIFIQTSLKMYCPSPLSFVCYSFIEKIITSRLTSHQTSGGVTFVALRARWPCHNLFMDSSFACKTMLFHYPLFCLTFDSSLCVEKYVGVLVMCAVLFSVPEMFSLLNSLWVEQGFILPWLPSKAQKSSVILSFLSI